MFTDKEQRLLIRKRKVELSSLGIDPTIYYQIDKLFNREFKFIYKKYTPFVYQGDKPMDENKLLEVIVALFNLSDEVATLVLCEWTRDRIIYHNMMENQKKCFDYLSLPLPYNDNDNEGFNF